MPEFHFVLISHRHCRVELADAETGHRRPVGTLKRLTATRSEGWMLLAARSRPTGFIYPDLASAQAAITQADPELLRRLGLNPGQQIPQ